ncbi:hypothetical protein Q8A73_015621 [Channa argus]|nr:hypothetical protein Q8A73_015621 [Channa argus]
MKLVDEEDKPSYYKVTGDDGTTACLATDFSRYNATNIVWPITNTSKNQPPVRISGDSVFNQVAIISINDTCESDDVKQEVCTDVLTPDPKVNFVTMTILGLRLLFIKTIVFNVLITLRLWISQFHTCLQRLGRGLRTRIWMWSLAVIELHENACVTDEGGGGFCLKACWDRIFTADRKSAARCAQGSGRSKRGCSRLRSGQTAANIRQQQRRRNNMTSEYFQHVVEKTNNQQLKFQLVTGVMCPDPAALQLCFTCDTSAIMWLF